jgi:ESF2/ABP1 family protein
MNPTSLRKLMENRFEGVERIYMEQEKEHVHKNRVKSGGNKKLKYTEGWVEFKDKKIAKTCALMLNNNNIGGKKRHNLFYDDIWNIQYLSKFKWSHLTEKLVYDQKMREQRLKTEMN